MIKNAVIAGLVLTVLAFAWLADIEHTARVQAEQRNGLQAVTTTITPTSAVSQTFTCYAYIQSDPWTPRAEVFESHQPAAHVSWFEEVDGATCRDAAGLLTDHGWSGGLGVEDSRGQYRRCVGR